MRTGVPGKAETVALDSLRVAQVITQVIGEGTEPRHVRSA